MLSRLQLLRNIGQFDSVSTASTTALGRLTLIYAENGRGKTTLTAILRSLGTGDPIPIAERRRLAAVHAPHVVLDCTGGPPSAIFQNNAWNRVLPGIVVFDDIFVHENVCAGLEVDPDHRQKLHELILGSQAVALTRELQQHVAAIEHHNASLRAKAALIPVAARGPFGVDEFCALQPKPNIDAEIETTERTLAAAREQEPIRVTPAFETPSLPPIDVTEIEGLLQHDLPELDSAAAAKVHAHLASIGPRGEAWVSDGISRIAPSTTTPVCPLCAQDLSGSPILQHYRAYFSQAYVTLKQDIADAIGKFTRLHSDEAPATFERTIRLASDRRQFWSRFCEVPELNLDTAEIGRIWRIARQAVLSVLQAKQAAPLERLAISQDVTTAIAGFAAQRDAVTALAQGLKQANTSIRVVKEQAAAGNPVAIQADLARLKAIKARHTPEIATFSAQYVAEQAAKSTTAQRRDQAKVALQRYRETVFPAYETATNDYLRRFNAGFRLGEVLATDTRGGPTCTYCVVINATSIPVAGAPTPPGSPSFRTTLSSGDRNTLALAFFFASLEQDASLADKIVVIDDPITSLDEHRSLTTVQEMRRLKHRTTQLILLSHSKPFLCRMWEDADKNERTALHLTRNGDASAIEAWDVTQDCITEHDRRHLQLREYSVRQTPNHREIAREIRPLIEAFLRVACPEHFPPGTLLGPFYGRCDQRLATPQHILNQDDTRKLGELIEYANRFHHDSNPSWEHADINDAQLLGFVQRALAFTRR